MSKTVDRIIGVPVATAAIALAPAMAAHAVTASGAPAEPAVLTRWTAVSGGVAKPATRTVGTVADDHDQARGKKRPPRGSYIVSVTTQAGTHALATLNCRPNGGGHPHRRQACAQLAEVDGDIAAIPAAAGACTMEYDPVLVRAVGAWDGHHHEFDKVFSNRCVAVLETGGYLFDI